MPHLPLRPIRDTQFDLPIYSAFDIRRFSTGNSQSLKGTYMESDRFEKIVTFWFMGLVTLLVFSLVVLVISAIYHGSQKVIAAQPGQFQQTFSDPPCIQLEEENPSVPARIHNLLAANPPIQSSSPPKAEPAYEDAAALQSLNEFSGVARGFDRLYHKGIGIRHRHILIDNTKLDYNSDLQAYVIAAGQPHASEVAEWETTSERLERGILFICKLKPFASDLPTGNQPAKTNQDFGIRRQRQKPVPLTPLVQPEKEIAH